MTEEQRIQGVAPVRVILISGGMDSGVLACRYFHQDNQVKTHAISFCRDGVLGAAGLRHAAIIADRYCHSHEVVKIPFMWHVDFRRGIMLSVAVGYANTIGASCVTIGSDPPFLEPFKQAAIAGTASRVRVYAPFAAFTKREIALEGQRLGFDFAETWSCERDGNDHCGVCGGCTNRRGALDGFDPTVYNGGGS